MVFSSTVFLLTFLPLTLAAYFLLPQRHAAGRNLILLAASLLFYGWGEPRYIFVMFLSILFNYLLALVIEKERIAKHQHGSKVALVVCMVLNLAVLFFFKYTDFLIETVNRMTGGGIGLLNIALPIGISFYTFQTMSYVIDVYRAEVKAQHNFLAFAMYVTLFPQLIAGPIVKYRDIAQSLTLRPDDGRRIARGISRFAAGFAKKVLLANQVFVLWNDISHLEEMSIATAWLGAVAFTMQIYFDFSGYSDMAIGLGRIFGFEYLENFNYPYIASSITDFWRRWHISLSSWFREYVYIPLGGNRKGRLRQLFNIAAVWALTGLWHGAGWNFILWGLYFAVILICEKLFLLKMLSKAPAFLRHGYALLLIMAGWVLFALEDMSAVINYFSMMLGASAKWTDQTFFYLAETRLWLLLLCCLGATPLPKKVWIHLENRLSKRKSVWYVFETLLISGSFLLSTAFLISGSYNPFLYFRF